jgi:hypothetical protein
VTKNPLAPAVKLEGLKGAQGRLTRAIERDESIGAPDNERAVFEKNGRKVAVGKITFNDWRDRVSSMLTPAEIKEAREWYGDLHRMMSEFFGAENAERYALAWLLSQQNESPSGGMRNVLRAADMVRGLPEIKKAGLGQDKIIEALRGEIPKSGYEAKLLDFIDSEMRRPTRTVMGDDPRGGKPAVIDVWANRDVGKVDGRVQAFIEKEFGAEAAAKLQLDGERIQETDYEYGSKFYNDLTKQMNAERFDGGKWLPLEAQAVGWVAMQKLMGAKPEFPTDVFDKNTRRVSVGLAPGTGTDMPRGEIESTGARRAINAIALATGTRIREVSEGKGAYLGESETALQIDVLGSPESLQDFAAVVGLVLKQTEVIISRALKSGKTFGFNITEVGTKKLASPEVAENFMSAVRSKLPSGYTIANGYQQAVVAGRPTLRLFHGTWSDAKGRVDWNGKWKGKEIEAFEQALAEVAHENGIGLDVTPAQFEVVSEFNDWQAQPNGEGYRDSLKGRGRSVLEQRVGTGELRLLPGEFAAAASRGRGERGKSESDPLAARAEVRAANDKRTKSRQGKCHTLVARKLWVENTDPERYTQIIGATMGAPGLKIWHSILRDNETGNLWEPISNRWHTPQMMREAYGFDPVLAISYDNARKLAFQNGIYPDQTLLKPRGWESLFLMKGDYDVDESLMSGPMKAQASQGRTFTMDDKRFAVELANGKPFDYASVPEAMRPVIDGLMGKIAIAKALKPEFDNLVR